MRRSTAKRKNKFHLCEWSIDISLQSLLSVVYRSLLETARPPGELYVDLANQYPEELLRISLLQKQLFIMKPRPFADLLVHRSYDFIKPSHLSELLRHVLGDGLIIVEGSQHKFLRKNTMPAFHFRHIRDLYPMMWAKSISLTSALQQGISGRERMDSHIVGKSGHVGYYRDCRNGS